MDHEQVRTLEVDLDPINPRLSSEQHATQAELLETLVTRYKLEELAESIIASGYLPFDPLVGYRKEGRIRVREGNRRIATLKLLLDPGLAPAKKLATWSDLSARLTGEKRSAIQTVKMIVFESENSPEIESYIGYRHVNGVMEWGAQEKAKFIVRLADEHKWSYKQIAERLGSYPKHVERHYIASKLLAQASESELPGASEIRLGVLLRALQAAGVATFLGIEYPGDSKRSARPVDDAHEASLRDFVKWTFGTDEEKPVLRDSRDLTKWGKILQSTEAVRYLRRTSGPTFDRAWLKSGGELESVVESLLVAADRLEEAVPLAPQHSEDQDVANAVKRCTSHVALLLPYFPEAAKVMETRRV